LLPVVVSAALLGLAATCSAAPAQAPRTLFSLGDSLAIGTDTYLGALLPDWTIASSAVVGRRSGEGLQALKRRRGKLPRVLLVSLGTNDDPTDVQGFTAVVKEIERIAGRNRCVVWATIVRPPVGGVTYDGLNKVLRAEDSRLKNFRLVDWETIVERTPAYLREDGVHAVSDGYRARATEAARVIRRC
jgi:lysophospholipase L1-like esterase